jgi:hypothetical protein
VICWPSGQGPGTVKWPGVLARCVQAHVVCQPSGQGPSCWGKDSCYRLREA